MLCNAYDDMASFSYHNTRGVTSPQPHEATRRTMTQGGYPLRVRHPKKLGDDDKDCDGCRVAQDN
jgi:hypothetical protein